MRKLRAIGGLAIATAAVLALLVTAAGASVVRGNPEGSGSNNCVQNFLWIQETTSSPVPSYVMPIGGGVITTWATSVGPTGDPAATMTLKVFRKTADNAYVIVGSSAARTL